MRFCDMLLLRSSDDPRTPNLLKIRQSCKLPQSKVSFIQSFPSVQIPSVGFCPFSAGLEGIAQVRLSKGRCRATSRWGGFFGQCLRAAVSCRGDEPGSLPGRSRSCRCLPQMRLPAPLLHLPLSKTATDDGPGLFDSSRMLFRSAPVRTNQTICSQNRRPYFPTNATILHRANESPVS